MMMDEENGGDNENSTYSKFKTQNELDIEKAFETGPKKMELDEDDEVEDFGTIRQYISQGVGMVLIEPTNPLKLYDIENLVTVEDKDKKQHVIGFIFELVGPITAPLYSI
jgi:hypothetical protein